MKKDLEIKLDQLRADYTKQTGQAFEHFYCPILFRDEKADLCKAHIINQCFHNSSRKWTILRNDVDNFYGSVFEKRISLLQHSIPGLSAEERLKNKSLSPRILKNGKRIDYFFTTRSEVPPNCTPIKLSDKDGSFLVLKVKRESMTSLNESNWILDSRNDLRLEMLVSLIKAAHLTLFSIIGYSYILRASGQLVGRQILGEFFLQNYGKRRQDALTNACCFFQDYVHMIRPVPNALQEIRGTVEDGKALICRGSSSISWAIIVFIRTNNLLHAVMLPAYENPEMIITYLDFLRNSNESIKVSNCRFNQSNGALEIDSRIETQHWPKSDTLFFLNRNPY